MDTFLFFCTSVTYRLALTGMMRRAQSGVGIPSLDDDLFRRGGVPNKKTSRPFGLPVFFNLSAFAYWKDASAVSISVKSSKKVKNPTLSSTLRMESFGLSSLM